MSFIKVCRTLACLACLAAVALASCTDVNAPVRRFSVLDDVGQGDWQSVSTGGDHTCALKTDGTAYCWGSNAAGQLGTTHVDTLCGVGANRYPCNPTPRLVATPAKFIALSAGARHTCGLTTNRAIFCWGANDTQQVSDAGSGGPTLQQVPGTLPWAQVSAGTSHTCAIRSDGALFCWGSNDRGQLGNGTFISSGGLVRISLGGAVASVSAGLSRTCARTVAGQVFCWGAIWIDRENGLEFTRQQALPALVPGSPALSSISVGSFTTCGTDRTGLAYCWEANPRGEIGDGTQEGATSPVRTASDLPFVQISAGLVQTCGIAATGTAYCWGDDSFGQLGVGTASLLERCSDALLVCATRPVAVVGRQQFRDISTGFGSHSCGVTVKGNLYCWGLGVSGQRGDGTWNSGISTPLKEIEPAALPI
jgi:alpha-tubulin suppressor-like RCC1 family protein